MHLLSRFGPQALAALLSLATQGVTQSVPAPNIDFDALGQVVLAGDFDSISVYSFSGQQQGFSSNGTQSILSHLEAGAYATLASTDASIEAMCPFVLKNGEFQGIVVGGNFTSIGGVNSRSVALFNPTNNQIVPLPGINGVVSALLCDQDTETVYVGGSFEAANSSNAIAWIAAGAWANLPFAGFDAPVTSIAKGPDGNVVFGGSFTGLHNTNGSSMAVTTQNTRIAQAINLSTANVTSTNNATSPTSIVCPPVANPSPFLLRDNVAGSWQADFRFGFEPSKIRMWNTNQDGQGTKTWRLTALPLNGIMNLTYTNPENGREESCSSACPLAHNNSIPFQDFFFVNRIGMNSFRIDVSEWYGNGGGFNGVQIFQDEIFAYAEDAFNEPECAVNGTRSSVTTTGPWYSSPSRESNSDYLSVVVGLSTVDTTNVVFEPDVPTNGNYSIIVYTPGCMQDSSCSARGIVNVTGTLTTDGQTTFSSQIYQTNNFDKYDQVFQGRVDASTTSFRPRVTITASGLTDDQLVVASRIRFALITSSGGLNGLFEYNPNQAIVDMDFSRSAINSAGTMLQPDAQILALATHEETLYAAGQFSDDNLTNIMAFANNEASSLPQGGLNSAVADLFSLDDFLYVGGNFSGTSNGDIQGLANIAAYQYSTNQWVALGAGLNGRVDRVEPLPLNITAGSSETAVAFSGSFSRIESFSGNDAIDVDGMAIWVPSAKTWLQYLNSTQQALRGQLFTTTYTPNGTWLGAGTLASQGQAVSGAVGLQSSEGQLSLQTLPFSITDSDSQSNLRKRAVFSEQNITGVTTGAYYNVDGRNVTIFAGHFTATGSQGSTIENLLFMNGSNNDATTGLPEGVDINSTFLTLAVQGSTLFAGGLVSGRVNDAQVGGLVLYDLGAADFRATQPAALQGENVIVNALATQPDTTRVYVGGSFERTSQDLSCPCVCMYDTSVSQWSTVGSGLDGTVTALFWSSGTSLIAAGNLSVGGNETSLATYDSKDQIWTVMDGPNVPGPVAAFAPATVNADHLWVAGTAQNGSTYLIEIDGQNSRPVVDQFGSGTTIRGLQVLPLSKNHGSSQYLDNDRALLVTGQLNITNFGYASAALFNGTSMNPLILSSQSNGDPGSISQLVSSNTNTLKQPRRGRSTGIVVLVALCAALGCIFLLILIGLLLNRIQRRRAGYSKIPPVAYADKHSNMNRVPPERLFGSLGASRQMGAPKV